MALFFSSVSVLSMYSIGALLFKCLQATPTGLMIMASHQTFLDFPVKLNICSAKLTVHFNGDVIEFAKGNECLDNFQSLS